MANKPKTVTQAKSAEDENEENKVVAESRDGPDTSAKNRESTVQDRDAGKVNDREQLPPAPEEDEDDADNEQPDPVAPKDRTGAGTAEDPTYVVNVSAPGDGQAGAAGQALTERQRAGLDPLDPAKDAAQAAHRDKLTNMQTDHEAENALDPVSGGPNTAVTSDAPLTARQVGAPASDMSGRLALDASDVEVAKTLGEALKAAKEKDGDDEAIADDRVGWRTPQALGIPGAVVERIYKSKRYPLEMEEVPGGAFFPETGRRYRIGSKKK